MVYKCPSCGKVNTLFSRQSKSYLCSKCGSIVNISNNEFSKTQGNPQIYPMSRLNLHKEGVIQNTNYKVIGFLAYEGIEEQWYTEEWIIKSATEVHFLEYEFEEDVYYLYKPTTSIDKSKLQIQEQYSSKLTKVAGEFPFLVNIPSVVQTVEGIVDGKLYTIEKDEELEEVFEKISLTREEVLTGFNLSANEIKSGDALAKSFASSESLKKNAKGSSMKPGGILALIFGIPAMLLFAFSPNTFNNCRTITRPVQPTPTITIPASNLSPLASSTTPTPTSTTYQDCITSTRNSSGRSFFGGGSGGK